MDREDRQKKADLAKGLALDLYEAKIADKSISASEMAVYLKLLSQLGLEGVLPVTSPTTKSNLPSFEDEEGDPIPFPSSKAQ